MLLSIQFSINHIRNIIFQKDTCSTCTRAAAIIGPCDDNKGTAGAEDGSGSQQEQCSCSAAEWTTVMMRLEHQHVATAGSGPVVQAFRRKHETHNNYVVSFGLMKMKGQGVGGKWRRKPSTIDFVDVCSRFDDLISRCSLW